MISPKLQQCIDRAFQYSLQWLHEYITLEHLLLALCDDDEISEIFTSTSLDKERLKKDIKIYLDGLSKVKRKNPPQPTVGFQSVLQQAAMQVQGSGRNLLYPSDILVALFDQKESYALYFIQQQGLQKLDVLNFISHGTQEEESLDPNLESTPQKSQNILTKFCENLNEMAANQQIDPLIGRKNELERIFQILCRRRKNNPLLVGEPGVGKTALAEGLALKIVEGNVPDLLKDYVVYSLDVAGLLAGTKFRGEFEQRLKSLIKAIQKEKKVILFIDEIHTIVGAGAIGGGSMDASNFLKPALASGNLKCIGTTSFKEYRNIIEKDKGLTRRFQKVDILEPSLEESYLIVKGLAKKFSDHHHVKYSPKALLASVDLAKKHIRSLALPDSAIDLIDEAGASAQLRKKHHVGVKEIEEVLAKTTGVKISTVSQSDTEVLKNLEQNLKLSIYGQNQAIDKVTTVVQLSKAGLGMADKPLASFLFAGPTGVGKTELAKQLALNLGIHFLRFDMSEYMEKHTVSRLIGAPPGYVGFDQGGLLTDGVRKNPHSLILLDEIEKAHPDLTNILLQVMDHGTLTDTNGNIASFRNSLLVMTTNVGTKDMGQTTMGVSSSIQKKEVDLSAVKKYFSPEFINRLDAVIHFKALQKDAIINVVEKFINQLKGQLQTRNVELSIDKDALLYLAEKGYDYIYGARPMDRLIQEEIKKPLSKEILFGKLQKGGECSISFKKGKISINTHPLKVKEKVKP